MMLDYPSLFGRVAPAESKDWRGSVIHNEHSIEVSLVIENEDFDTSSLHALYAIAADIKALEARARAAIEGELAGKDSSVQLYLDHHRDELPQLSGTNTSMIGALRLTSVTLYPEDPDDVIHLDFSIAPEATDYVILVAFNMDLLVTRVEMES